MRILFICGSVEPGKDGVGDYTRRLCGELIRIGHEVNILSLCDFQASSFLMEYQESEGTKVCVNRIPIATSNKQRSIWTRYVLNNFEPGLISLQYVPYSFNQKGLPFWLPYFLKKLRGNFKRHIMFHELWIGIDIESSFKHKCISKIQQFIVRQVVYKVKTDFVDTQNKLYQSCLQSNNIEAEVLPICSNIPVTGVRNKGKKFTQIVLFGTIHPAAPFKDFIDDLVQYKRELNKPIKFVFIGKNGPLLSNYLEVLKDQDVGYEVMGIQSEDVISQTLIDSDYGISTTPYFQTEKSGVFAAYKEHQISTICVSRKWTPTVGKYTIPNIIKYEKDKLELSTMNFTVYDLSCLANQFIKSISV